jgi:hypothetical protein
VQHYHDNITNRNGGAVSQVGLLVRQNGVAAVLYSDNGITRIDNPVYSDTNGEISFYAANGTYDISVVSPTAGATRQSPITLFDEADSVIPNFGTSGGSSHVGFIQSGGHAVGRTTQAKAREVFTPQDAGAVGDNSTTDTTAVQNALTDYGAVHLPATTGYKVGTLSVAASSHVSGEGRGSPLNFVGTAGLQVAGSNVTLRNLRFSGPGSTQLIAATASASDVTLDSIDLSSDITASPNGIGVQVNQSSSHRWRLIGSTLNVYGFGYLQNDGAGGSVGHVVSGNYITTQTGDCVEINTPTTAAQDVVISGNVLKVAAGSGTAEGFGVGLAHVNGAAVLGNVIERAWVSSLHVEDGSKNVSFIGNVSKSCQSHGLTVNAGGTGGNQAQAKAVIAIGNQLEADSIGAGLAGIYIIYDGSGTVYGSSIVGNVVRNFESGLWLGGNATHHASGNTIDSCTYAIRCETGDSVYTRITGSNIVLGTATALLYASGATGVMVQAGSFICDTKPTNIILKDAANRPGCSVAGFSWPQTQLLSAGSTTWTNLFPASSTCVIRGRLTVQAHNNAAAVADNTYFCADITWDGTTLTLIGAAKQDNGALASTGSDAYGALRVSGGQLQYGWFCASAITIRADVNFDGLYMV